jgi:EAL domain-containing protein (putative c-di-GMP-specific phosphodiesterase class I)
MQVIAEGVENALQVELLRTLGCDYGQGFHWARPAEPHAVSGML